MDYTRVTEQTRARINSKKWSLGVQKWVLGIPEIVMEPKRKEIHRTILDVPEEITLEEVAKHWDAVDVTMTPIFFCNCNNLRLGITWSELTEETLPKLEGRTNFVSVMVRPF